MALQATGIMHDSGPRRSGGAFSFMPRTFRAKLILFALGVSLVSSLLLAVVNYVFVANVTKKSAIERLAADVRIRSVRFADVFGDFESDADILADMPPINGIIRTSGTADNVDPKDGSTGEQWRRRLELIFGHFLLERPHYTQLRYIGVADNGRELVRVDRESDGIKRTRSEDLQQKGDEAYFRDSLDLHPDEVHISDVTYNREHGTTDPGRTPTIRIVAPVFDGDRTLFGFVIINADYRALLQRAFADLHAEHVVTVVNDKGDYLQQRPGEDTARFRFHEAPDWVRPPFLDTLLNTEEPEAELTQAGEIAYMVRIPIGSKGQESFLGIVASAPEDVVLAGAQSLLRQNLLFAVLLVLIASICATLLGWQLTRPLRWLTAAIASRPAHGKIDNLPIEGRDEISDLARTFQKMSNELIQASEQAKQSEARLGAIVNTAPVGILSVDQQGVILTANDTAGEIFGYESEGLIGEPIAQLVPPRLRDRHGDNHLHFLEGGGQEKRVMAAGRAVVGQRRDGREVALEIGLSKITLADGSRQAVATIQDVSERRAAAEALRRYAEDLERSNTDLDEFAYVASHDLKAPLRVIDNASKWLEEDLEEHLDEDSQENMQLLRGRVKRMERLLDDLLEYSRIGRRSDERFQEPVKGDVLIDDVLQLLVPPESFEVVVDPAFAGIEVKRMPLQQIFHNLINNAIKHHHKDRGRIEVSLKDQGDRYAFAVSDDGPGIAPEFQDQVFKMFQTLKPRDQVEGSGMGLAVVKKQIETFGGSLTLHSVEGEGSAFRFTWPKDQRMKQRGAHP